MNVMDMMTLKKCKNLCSGTEPEGYRLYMFYKKNLKKYTATIRLFKKKNTKTTKKTSQQNTTCVIIVPINTKNILSFIIFLSKNIHNLKIHLTISKQIHGKLWERSNSVCQCYVCKTTLKSPFLFFSHW